MRETPGYADRSEIPDSTDIVPQDTVESLTKETGEFSLVPEKVRQFCKKLENEIEERIHTALERILESDAAVRVMQATKLAGGAIAAGGSVWIMANAMAMETDGTPEKAAIGLGVAAAGAGVMYLADRGFDRIDLARRQAD